MRIPTGDTPLPHKNQAQLGEGYFLWVNNLLAISDQKKKGGGVK